nr:uncharacterized protein LOC123574509 isoform X1 [Macaca fascicularis]
MALSQVPGLRVLELLSIKDEDDLAHTAAGWRNVTQRRGFRLRGARGDPKDEGRASAVSAPGWTASPPAGEFVPSSSRISPSIAPLGPQREAARPGGGLKSAFCSLPGPQSHSTAVWAAGSADRAQGQRSLRVCAGAGRGSRARSDFCGPWLPSRGREAPWSARARGTLRVYLVGVVYWESRRKVPCKSACTVLFGSQQPGKQISGEGSAGNHRLPPPLALALTLNAAPRAKQLRGSGEREEEEAGSRGGVKTQE